jgi:hypothetical protein
MNSLMTNYYRDVKKFEHGEKYRNWQKISKQNKIPNPTLIPQTSINSLTLDRPRASEIHDTKPENRDAGDEDADEQVLRRRILLEAAQKRMDSKSES